MDKEPIAIVEVSSSEKINGIEGQNEIVSSITYQSKEIDFVNQSIGIRKMRSKIMENIIPKIFD